MLNKMCSIDDSLMFRGKTPVVLCDVCQMSNSGSHPQGSSHGGLTPGGKYRVIGDIQLCASNSLGFARLYLAVSRLQGSGPKIGGVTLPICAMIKLDWAVIKSKLGSVKHYS